jgi:hypothetical protein
MLYLLGGASRAGKTTIAQRLLKERRVSYFVLDYFVSALTFGAPELGVHHDQPNPERAERLWSRLRPMLRNIVEEEPCYLVEGDTLLPGPVSDLAQEYPGAIRACFVGYPTISPMQKFRDIRERGRGVNDWVRGHPDEYVLALVNEEIAFSSFLQSECQKHGLPFFDGSHDFVEMIDRAVRYLDT